MRQFALYVRRRSRLAAWSRRVAVFAVVLALLAVVLHRADVLDPVSSLATLGGVVVLAVLALLLGLGGIVRIWRRGHMGLAHALTGIALSLALLAWPTYLVWESMNVPMINDIATDWSDPPEMRAAVLDRSPISNPVRMPRAEEIARQAEAYPEIRPLVVNVPSQRVYDAARELAVRRGWRILEEARPDERGPGRLEMVARTRVLGFKDDVVLIVTNLGEGRTRVDMRSASRFGRHDFGTNARRIFGFLTELDAELKGGALLG